MRAIHSALTCFAIFLSACGGGIDSMIPYDETMDIGMSEQAARANQSLFGSVFGTGEGVCHDIGSAFVGHGMWAPGTGAGCSYDYNLALAQCREPWMCPDGVHYCVDMMVRSPRCGSWGSDAADAECCNYLYCKVCKCKNDNVGDTTLPYPAGY